MTSKEQKYYKVLTKDLKAPNNTRFSYKWWRIKSFKVKGQLETCSKGLHLYKSLENLSIGFFGERVFEAIPVGEYISSNDKICCRKIKLIKEIKPEEVKDPKWACRYCHDVKDIPEIYKHITGPQWAYWYCRYVKDRPEVYKHIIDSVWAYYYCRDVKNRPEVYKNITEFEWAHKYCRYIEDRPEVYEKITDSKWAYWYCVEIKDRPEVYKNITDSEWAYHYCHNIKDRPEIHKYITNLHI